MSRVAVAVLAAGGSTRLGFPKQLLRIDGESLVRRAARAALASRCERVFVVVGAHAPLVVAELDGLALTVIENPRWQEGLASSIGAGVDAVAAATDPAVDAVLLMHVDQPAVTSALLDRLIAGLDDAPAGLVAAEYGGGLGAPALFARRHFAALRSLSGDRGGKGLLAAHADTVVRIQFPEGALDVDTPADVQHVRKSQP